MIKKLSLFVILIISFITPLFALSGETIVSASGDMLKAMASARGLDVEGSDEEVRNRLFEYEGIERVEVRVESTSKSGDYSLEIINADSLSKDGDIITLDGNVIISFSYGDEKAKRLSSSRVIVDTVNNKISALGGARYTDSSLDAPIQETSADIFTILWEDGDLYISGGVTRSERKNSDDKSVSFYTTGETLSYSTSGAMLYDNGYITSNPVHAYSSISASRIAILPGEDMFLSSALFKIGRVPMFWLPFFFYPGSRILGNPSFGFSSIKGAFLNTTFEIFGSYPSLSENKETSSFSSMLKATGDQSSYVPNGYYYSEASGDESALRQWARATKSYLAILFDVYGGSSSATLPDGGIHLALDSSISLLDGKVKLNLLDGIAYSSPVGSGDQKFRYYGKNTLEANGLGGRLSLSFPFYSDQLVTKDFSNRLTGFSFSPLMGEESSFPTAATAVNSFSRTLAASWDLPSNLTSFFLNRFSLQNLSIKENFDYSTPLDGYVLSERVLPSLSLKLSGSLFSIKGKETEVVEEAIDRVEEKETEEKDPLLFSPYSFAKAEDNKKNKEAVAEIKSTWAMDGDYYSSESFKETVKSGDMKTLTLSGKINAEGRYGTYIEIRNTLDPALNYKKNGTASTSYSVVTKETILLSDTITVSVPYLGLSYNLSLRLLDKSHEISETISSGTSTLLSEKDESKEFGWNRDSVKSHELTFEKSFSTFLGSITGRLNYVLPPLLGVMTPSLAYKSGGFSSSISFVMREKEGGSFEAEKASFSLSYSSTHFSARGDSSYLFSSSSAFDKSNLNLSSSLSLFTKDKKWSLEGKGQYMPLSKSGVENWFPSLSLSFRADAFSGTFSYSSKDDGTIGFDRALLKTNLESRSIQFWRGRVFLSFAIKSTLDYNHRNRTKSTFTIEPQVKFSVAEFLDFSLTLTSENRRIGSYFDGDEFSFSSMFQDLVRSLDFLGEGRKNTSFIMRSVSLEAVHVMEDWDLNCKYSTELVKSTVAGNTVYTLQPSLSIYLSWKTMPDLKVEEIWRQTSDASGNPTWEKY